MWACVYVCVCVRAYANSSHNNIGEFYVGVNVKKISLFEISMFLFDEPITKRTETNGFTH